jgi:hypothetical protein
VTNGGGTGRTLLQRFRKGFSEWLETGRLPKATQFMVAVFLFVAGIGFQILFQHRLENVFKDTQGKIWLIILLYIISAIVLTIVASVWIAGLSSILNRVIGEHHDTRTEIHSSQEAVLDAVKSMVGLTAEYIDDKDRAYERTQHLIQNARERLIFVDWWVDIHRYDTDQARKDYYHAITARIKKHLDESGEGKVSKVDFSHSRIVQMEANTELDSVSSILFKDEVYWEHIKTVVELQEDRPGLPSVYIAEPYTRAHFAIIDDVFVQPILTTSSKGLQRYGAILYTDRHGELIKRYEQLVDDLEKKRLRKEHLLTKQQTK